MKGRLNDNFDITVYDLEGNVIKEFYNFNESTMEEMYEYYTINGEYVVRVEGTETMYDLHQLTDNKRKR